MESRRNGPQLSSRHDDDDDHHLSSSDENEKTRFVITSIRRFLMKRSIVCIYTVSQKTRTRICFKFLRVRFCHKLAKSDEIWQIYHKNKKGEVFFETQCIIKNTINWQISL